MAAGNDPGNFPIDDEADKIPLPEIVPLDRRDSIELIKRYEKIVDLLLWWAEVNLRVLSYHTLSPEPDYDVDSIPENGFKDSRSAFADEYRKVLDSPVETPIGFNEDQLHLLDSQKKPKPGPGGWSIDWFRFLKYRKGEPEKEKKPKDSAVKSLVRKVEDFCKNFRNRKKTADADARLKHNTPVHESAEVKWLTDMTRDLQICQVYFKYLKDEVSYCSNDLQISFFDEGTTASSYSGGTANDLKGQIAEIMAAKVFAITLVSQIEDELYGKEWWKDCFQRYDRASKKEDPVLQTAAEKMSQKETIVSLCDDQVQSGSELMADTDDQDINLLDHKVLPSPGKATQSTKPQEKSVEAPVPVSALDTNIKLTGRPRPKASSASVGSLGQSALVLSNISSIAKSLDLPGDSSKTHEGPATLSASEGSLGQGADSGRESVKPDGGTSTDSSSEVSLDQADDSGKGPSVQEPMEDESPEDQSRNQTSQSNQEPMEELPKKEKSLVELLSTPPSYPAPLPHPAPQSVGSSEVSSSSQSSLGDEPNGVAGPSGEGSRDQAGDSSQGAKRPIDLPTSTEEEEESPEDSGDGGLAKRMRRTSME